jgi:hypothetical protein
MPARRQPGPDCAGYAGSGTLGNPASAIAISRSSYSWSVSLPAK